MRSPEAAGIRAINMEAKAPILARERRNFAFFDTLPDDKPAGLDVELVRALRYLTPLFEFSGACAGCGETPYLRLLTRALRRPFARGQCRPAVRPSTGAIYAPTPWSVNETGVARPGPIRSSRTTPGAGSAWLSLDQRRGGDGAPACLGSRAARVGARSRRARRTAGRPGGGRAQRAKSRRSRRIEVPCPIRSPVTCARSRAPRARERVVRGGWVGLRHRLRRSRSRACLSGTSTSSCSTPRCIRTGGQPRSRLRAVAWPSLRPAASGRKKDLRPDGNGLRKRLRGASPMGASSQQTMDALLEAEAHDGPSLIIAYHHCIAHGINMRFGMRQQKLAVECVGTGRSIASSHQQPAGTGRNSCSTRKPRRFR